ncbi:DUF2931 family protein [Pseudomonas sp. IT-P74]
MMKKWMTLTGLLFLGGCQATDPLSAEHDPHSPWWSIDFQGPSYMLGWVENSTAEDINGKFFNNHMGGVIGTDTALEGSEAARGWHRAGGNVRPVTGAALPKRIFVRWQSVVEPQTYKVWVDIPEQAREIMRTSISRRCPDTLRSPYRASLTLGLAPGGVVQVWVRDSCHDAIKVARAQAEVEPLGPHLGKSNGHYYPQSEKSKRYIERYGIPYGSW